MRFRALAAAALVALAAAAGAARAQYATIYTWYSETRGDHFTTTDPRWAGEVGARRPDGGGSGYRLIRVEGSVLSPVNPQPADTVPLYTFWHGGRADNFLTSNPYWTARTADDGYNRIRLEGYVYPEPKAGTRPLVSYWSRTRADNFSTTDPRLALEVGSAAENRTETVSGGRYASYRIEGYMLPPPGVTDIRSLAHSANLTAIDFGALRPLGPSDRGVLPSDPIDRATSRLTTPMVILPLAWGSDYFEWADVTRFARIASPSDDLSIQRAVSDLSRDRFTWDATVASIVRDPLSFDALLAAEDALEAFLRINGRTPESFETTNGFGLEVYDLDGDGPEADEIDLRARALKLSDPYVAYDRYDANRDGRVDKSELVVLRFGSGSGIGGQMGENLATTLDGKVVETAVGLLAKDSTLNSIMHELLHVWGAKDVYGPGFALNWRSTIMGGGSANDLVWELDPWHHAKFGWVRPRFVPINAATRAAGGVEFVIAAGHARSGYTPGRPIVFYDPARGLAEFFVVQYRTPFPACPGSELPRSVCADYRDNGVIDMGLAVWHVVTDGEGQLLDIRNKTDIGRRIAWPGGSCTSDRGTSPYDTPRDCNAHMLRMGVVSPINGKIGGRRYLARGDGEMRLHWWDGADTGLRLGVLGASQWTTDAIILWSDATREPTLRLDILRAPGFPTVEYPLVNAGAAVEVEGVFGAWTPDFHARLVAEEDGAVWDVGVSDYFDEYQLTLYLPGDAPAGRYKLVVGRGAAISNGLKLEIPSILTTTLLPNDFDRGIAGPELRGVHLRGVRLDRPIGEAPSLPPEPVSDEPVPVDTIMGFPAAADPDQFERLNPARQKPVEPTDRINGRKTD